MKLSQAEIRNNAIAFAAQWKDAASERAESQEFWIDLFAVYGIIKRSAALYPHAFMIHIAIMIMRRLKRVGARPILGGNISRTEKSGPPSTPAAGSQYCLRHQAALTIFGFLVMTDLRELYSIVEYPVGYLL